MRMLSRVKRNGSSGGWFCFWAAALLVLPNCFLDRGGIVTPTNVNRGVFNDDPAAPERGFSSAIFCDIERPVVRRCATTLEIEGGIRLADAAIALVERRTSTTGGLDYSPDAIAECGGPWLVEFHGAFPEGSNVCLHCGTAIGPDPMTQHANNQAVCTALCLDLFDSEDQNEPPSEAALAHCTPERARLSTNFPADECFTGACSIRGTLRDAFADPRRVPEHVAWMNLDGVNAFGGDLVRIAPFTAAYDAGASSSQLITSGDAYFEFITTEINRARIAGLSSGPPPVGGVTFADIGFGLLFTETGEMFVSENGMLESSFGAYAAGEKFRVKLRDRFDGRADVTYVRIVGPCTDGAMCTEMLIWESDDTVAYPVRVDAMFRDEGSTITEARLVRIR